MDCRDCGGVASWGRLGNEVLHSGRGGWNGTPADSGRCEAGYGVQRAGHRDCQADGRGGGARGFPGVGNRAQVAGQHRGYRGKGRRAGGAGPDGVPGPIRSGRSRFGERPGHPGLCAAGPGAAACSAGTAVCRTGPGGPGGEGLPGGPLPGPAGGGQPGLCPRPTGLHAHHRADFGRSGLGIHPGGGNRGSQLLGAYVRDDYRPGTAGGLGLRG